MGSLLILLALSLAFSSPFLVAATSDTLFQGSSLSVEKPENDVLTSSNGMFSAGFFLVGDNAYCFGIWFSEDTPKKLQDRAIVWTANRDKPVNGKQSKLTLLKTGDLVLYEVGKYKLWATNTESNSSTHLQLDKSGNLVLLNSNNVILWKSFDYPTDTLLPNQPLTKITKLVSSRSQTNISSGFYTLYFNDENMITLLFDNFDISSIYWPPPYLLSWEAGRSTYNSSRIAMLDSLGSFSSSDQLNFLSADYGTMIQRRLRVDYDGNFRLYSREKEGQKWQVTWQAFPYMCTIHGVCGPNSICSYVPNSGKKCSCIPGHKMTNRTDWSYGCQPDFNLSCNKTQSIKFQKISNVEFYGYDSDYLENSTLSACQSYCLALCTCRGFQYKYKEEKNFFNCYLKALLLNGNQSPSFVGDIYIKVPQNFSLFYDWKSTEELMDLDCSKAPKMIHLERKYRKTYVKGTLKSMLSFACALGVFEIICILLVWLLLLFRTQKNSKNTDVQGYQLANTGFKRFSFAELKKATNNFSEEIGRGSGGIVYKGVLFDGRVGAIKRLNEAQQGEAEFLAEVSTIGRLNHMNLIEMWGYCAQGNHRILVYEYLEHGSLKQNLSSNVLDWKIRFEIAMGTAKGLAYLHEECLEWILHCDVKPQNILLDAKYQPKVSDFGLSKLLKRVELNNNASFSRIRGTRGYMAPEWVSNESITSKVDVYSYGIVVLEMLTGKSPTTSETEFRRVITWVKEKLKYDNYGSCGIDLGLENILDPLMEGEYEMEKVQILFEVALKCIEENKQVRPTMSQVVEMLQDQ